MAKNKNGLKIIIVFLLAAAAVAAVFFVYSSAVKDINGNQKKTKDYTLNIVSSDFQYEISQKLYQNGIIESDFIWTHWMDKHYPDFTYINGEYNLADNMSYEEIAEKLQNPDVSHKTVTVCIPEGYNIFDIADAMEKNGVCKADDFLEACVSAEKYDYEFLKEITFSDTTAYQLEGFLFPATYDLAENSEAEDIADEMLEAFSARISDDWEKYCAENDMTLYELITLASIVEKETLGDGVNKNIASVFINRLEINQKLQSDVTIFYGNDLREHGFDDKVVESYNTYKCKALPSGPVCNPGVENINAVIKHNDTDYFYFFSDLENQFHFAKDYDKFERLKKEFPWE